MATTFSFDVTYATEAEETVRTKSLQYGDGYRQDSEDGINTIPGVFKVALDQKSTTEANAIIAFFRAAKGVDHFLWTPPIPGWGAEIKVKCTSWRTRPAQFNSHDISCTFEQVFTSAT